MDFRVINPTFGWSGNIDEKSREWGGVEENILNYLCDVNHLEQFADMANDTDQLASYIDPFLQNAEKYFDGMEKLADGQVKWSELRKQFNGKVAGAIAKIRKLDAEFGSDMESINAQDSSDLLRIETKRQNSLKEIAGSLKHDLQAELFRHQNRMNDINNRQQVQTERQEIQKAVREKRASLMQRAKFGTRDGLNEQIKIG